MSGAHVVRAARLVDHGAPLEVVEVRIAEPRGDEVVVELSYAGVNPVDRYHALGHVGADLPLPRTLGMEGVGRLDGRWVALHAHGLGSVRDGLWAEAAVVPRAAVVAVPEGVAPEAAAVMGVAGTTAWRTVHELARVTEEDRVAVLGAGGGVGSMIVALTRSTGATVWGQTGSQEKAAAVERFGAERAVVAGEGDLADALAPLRPTVVFDPLGAGFTGAAVQALAPHGRLVLFGTSAGPRGDVPLRLLYRKGVTVFGYGGLISPDEALVQGLSGALDALADGRLAVALDAVLPLAEVNDALERLAGRRTTGKLVLALSR
jgi:NADPH2:quinone reductase